jgi:thymidylate synthase
LLHLLAKEVGLAEGTLIGFLGDTHVYVNHAEALGEQLARTPRPLPRLNTECFTSIFDWKYSDTDVLNYDPYPAVKFDIAV